MDNGLFCVPARGFDAQSEHQFSYVWVEDIDDSDIEWIAANDPRELLRLIDEALARELAERHGADVVTLHNDEPRHETVVECWGDFRLAAAE